MKNKTFIKTEGDVNRGKEVEDTVKEGSLLDQIPQDSAKKYKVEHRNESHSVVSNSFRPQGLCIQSMEFFRPKYQSG